MGKKILFVGESWHVHVTEAKGFDTFSFDYYEEAVEYIQAALEANGMEFHHIPSHLVEQKFPKTAEEIDAYDAIMFSDVGANTMNLPMSVFLRLEATPNKLALVADYVARGGAFVMIGGYLTFQGIEAKGAYHNTVIEEILPVQLLSGDDRVECSNGLVPCSIAPDHPVMAGVEGPWPQILGYNRLIPKDGAEILATVGEDPFLAIGSYGKGKTCAYATDCAPHWSPIPFCTWPGYVKLWGNLVNYLTV